MCQLSGFVSVVGVWFGISGFGFLNIFFLCGFVDCFDIAVICKVCSKRRHGGVWKGMVMTRCRRVFVCHKPRTHAHTCTHLHTHRKLSLSHTHTRTHTHTPPHTLSLSHTHTLTHTYTHTHTHKHTHRQTHAHKDTHKYVCMYVHVYLYTHMYICARKIHVNTPMPTHTFAFLCMHTYTHTCMYICVHVHVNVYILNASVLRPEDKEEHTHVHCSPLAGTLQGRCGVQQ